MTTIKELSNLKGRRALITGATGGLGRIMADTLAELGADLRLRPYISIVKAATRICGAISFAGIQSRHFNTFTCTLDATGVPPSSSRSLYFKHR